MQIEDIKINFVGMDSTDALKDYVVEKLSKFQNVLDKATHVEVFLKQAVAHRGAAGDFILNINVSVPGAVIRVEERGENMYALIDFGTDTLFTRFKRYQNKLSNWEGKESWKDIEIANSVLEDDYEDSEDPYLNYEPTIVARHSLENRNPMYEAEAIESMELGGQTAVLFRNAKTNKITMICKNNRGEYELTEE